MATKSDPVDGLPNKQNGSHKLAHEVEGAASGALAGGVLGAVAGPPGAVAGALIGALAGALTGGALDDDDTEKGAADAELDAAIGVSGGELGAPNLDHPAAKVGAYSSSSTGTGGGGGGSGESEPSDGPFQTPES